MGKKIATDAEAQRTAYAQFLLLRAYDFSEDAWLAQNVEGIQAAASAERRRVEIAVEPVADDPDAAGLAMDVKARIEHEYEHASRTLTDFRSRLDRLRPNSAEASAAAAK